MTQPPAFALPDTNIPLPVKPGDWVARRNSLGDVGRVKDVYFADGQVLIDLYIYSYDGARLGRVSPALDGPRNFEPACPYSGYRRIAPPTFPISLKWFPGANRILTAGYHHGAIELPDRQWIRRRRHRSPIAANPTIGNGAEVEAAALRIAAQYLRDTARQRNLPELLAQADTMDAQAQNILPR